MVNYTDTICYKITQCVNEMESAMRTHSFDIKKVVDTLVEIRSDAIRMEEGLKANKVLRLKHKIDPEYRELMKEKFTPQGINEIGAIRQDFKMVDEAPRYELTLKDDTGKTLYQNKIFAFVFCSVEQIENIDAAGMINGQVQTLSIGNDLAVWYAYDQLKQKFAGKMTELMLKMANTTKAGKFGNREQRRKFLRAANGKKVR